jgi:TonB family protein
LNPAGPLTLCALMAGGVSGCSGDQEIDSPSPLSASVLIDYPMDLWDQGIEGSSMLKVRVTDLGVVDSVVVMESSGYAAFDSSAVRGAKTLRFSPARQGDERIEVWAHVPVHFSKSPRP